MYYRFRYYAEAAAFIQQNPGARITYEPYGALGYGPQFILVFVPLEVTRNQ